MGEILLPDTNILLLLLVAQADPRILRTFKRVQQFALADLQTLFDVAAHFSRLQTTTHVLTETSNFIGQASAADRQPLLARFVAFLQTCEELCEPAQLLAAQPSFLDLGLSDAGLVEASRKATVLTMDGPLYGRILGALGNAIYFPNLRTGTSAGR